MKNYSIAETFVGAGGAHIGFKVNGFKSVYVNDINDDCIKTLLVNNPEIKDQAIIDTKDIVSIDIDHLQNKLKTIKLDVLFGGIVCKGFSLAGQRNPDDERNYYYRKQIELADALRPKISIIENVKMFENAKVLSSSTPQSIKDDVKRIWRDLEVYNGVKAEARKKDKIDNELKLKGIELRKNKKDILEQLLKNNYLISVIDDLRYRYNQIGYNVQIKILNTAWYGAATKRERIIIVAVRKDLNKIFKWPIPTHWSNEIKTKCDWINDKQKVQCKKALTVGEVLKDVKIDESDLDSLPMKHNEKTKQRFSYIPEGGNVQDVMHLLPENLKISKYYSRGNTSRLHRDKIAPTIVPGHSNFILHPTENRSITVREAALISGFPKNYKFVGNHSKRCEHVGNAVPPPLSNALAKSCIELIESTKN